MKIYIYIVSWIVLGSLLALLAHAGMEIGYINYLLAQNIVPVNYGSFGGHYCALPVWLQSGLVAVGLFGGFLAGKHFYRVIYIEKRYHWKK